MAIIENFKNFLRNGKQASPNPNTHVQHTAGQQHQQGVGISEPLPVHQHQHYAQQSLGGNVQNQAAQRANQVAHAQEKNQTIDASGRKEDAIQRIVAEEASARGKLPSYPGLEAYTLQEKMGDGAFSNVYRAKTAEGRNVAIKVVRKYELSKNQNTHVHKSVRKKPAGVERANILKEVQIMRTLNHPNIISLIEFTESKDYYFLVLELATGGELFHQIVRLTYFSEDLSRHVIVQVAHALKYLHLEKGVVHRDIKPENILFEPTPVIPSKSRNLRATDESDKEDEGTYVPGVGAGGIGRIKIADFGLSKVVWESQTMTPCGTVGYTAPEIVKNERYSCSVDMWALGCVLYTLLCGFPPFYDESIQQLTEKVARGQYTFLSPWWDEISKSAQDLISHLLTVDPEKRYTIEDFLQHPWIRGSDEATEPAFDAPPTGYKPNKSEFITSPIHQENTSFPAAMASPRVETPGRGFRSPGVVTLKEVFDVSYAVHRMGEENQRKRNKGTTNLRSELNNLGEETDEDEDVVMTTPRKVVNVSGLNDIERDLRKAAIDNSSRMAGQNQPGKSANSRRADFELNMTNATLLGRRNKGI